MGRSVDLKLHGYLMKQMLREVKIIELCRFHQILVIISAKKKNAQREKIIFLRWQQEEYSREAPLTLFD